jgi:hypothetical protein
MNASATIDLEALSKFAGRFHRKPVTADEVQREPQAAFPIEPRWLKSGGSALFHTQRSPMEMTADEVQPEPFPPFPIEPIWLKR